MKTHMKTMKILTIVAAFALLSACSKEGVEYDASGVFEATEVIVSARGNGEIVRLDLEEGQEVFADSVLGCIDTTQLYLKRKQLAATLSATSSRKLNSERQLASIKQQIANAEAEKKRFEELVNANAATQKQLDDINYQLEVLQKQLAATEEQITSSNTSISGQTSSISVQMAQIDDQIAQAKIASPIAGTVLTKYAEQGEFAAAGRALFKVGDIKHMKLRAYVTAAQVTELKIGQPAIVYADAGESGRMEFAGKVAWISDEAEFTPKTIQTRDERSNLVYAVKIAVTNNGQIKRGMYGDVKF